MKVLLAGAGGYAAVYVPRILACSAEWVGVVDPFVKNSPAYAQIVENHIPVYDTMEAFYRHEQADLAVIATPIPLHMPMSVYAMTHGSHVLMEKPIAGSEAQAREIVAARDQTGKKLLIGFQWCYDDVMLRLKQLSDSGALGRLVRMRSLVLWPRGFDYYARNHWAGKKYVGGTPVFDSVSSNATAHYLMNMLWLAGSGFEGARPESCRVRTFRANEIETFDTAAMLFTLPGGVQALHIASHAAGSENAQEPMFIYEYEKATVTYGDYGKKGDHILITYHDGRVEDLGQSIQSSGQSFSYALRACAEDSLPLPCPAEAAMCHIAAIAMARACQPEAEEFSKVVRDEKQVWVPGLKEQLLACCREFHLPEGTL